MAWHLMVNSSMRVWIAMASASPREGGIQPPAILITVSARPKKGRFCTAERTLPKMSMKEPIDGVVLAMINDDFLATPNRGPPILEAMQVPWPFGSLSEVCVATSMA